MSNTVPDAWDDEWSTAVDTTKGPVEADSKKLSTKVTKAQRRAQQAEFNRQLWAEAEGPQETNYFLESRNIVPLRSEFKPPPILLSRKAPTTRPSRTPVDGVSRLQIQAESSSDDEESEKKVLTPAERQALAAKEREEKQRKYEERRQELFGNPGTAKPKNGSGNTSPGDLTPPNSRSATPNRGRGRGRGRGNNLPVQPRPPRELFEPAYSPKPDSVFLQRRENGTLRSNEAETMPVRAPRGPDGSGRDGFGFASRGSRHGMPSETPAPTVEES